MDWEHSTEQGKIIPPPRAISLKENKYACFGFEHYKVAQIPVLFTWTLYK